MSHCRVTPKRKRLRHRAGIRQRARCRPGHMHVSAGVERRRTDQLQRTLLRQRRGGCVPQEAPERHLLWQQLHQRLEVRKRLLCLFAVERYAAGQRARGWFQRWIAQRALDGSIGCRQVATLRLRGRQCALRGLCVACSSRGRLDRADGGVNVTGTQCLQRPINDRCAHRDLAMAQ